MLKKISTIENFEIYHEDLDQWFSVELETDHENYDEQIITIEDGFGNNVEDDELWDELTNQFDDEYNQDYE